MDLPKGTTAIFKLLPVVLNRSLVGNNTKAEAVLNYVLTCIFFFVNSILIFILSSIWQGSASPDGDPAG